MFDKLRLQNILIEYKKQFVEEHWPKEKFKWEAIKCFKDNWAIDEDNFTDMLKRALSKTDILLYYSNYFPRKMIEHFSEAAMEEVRAMFIELFDENRDLYERLDGFKQKSKKLLERHGGKYANHYQDEKAITTYLWLHDPDKYYIYKFNVLKVVSEELDSDYLFKKGAYADNVRNFMDFYNEICEEINKDDELKNILRSQITEDCYPDDKLKTLTTDFGFYVSEHYKNLINIPVNEEWWPKDYTPGLTVKKWESLLKDNEIFLESRLKIVKRLQDYGGQATCSQLSKKYGGDINFYNRGSSSLAERIAKKTGCATIELDNNENKWWPILYLGRKAQKEENGSFVWKLRAELAEAIKKVDISTVNLYENMDGQGTDASNFKEEKGAYSKNQFLSEVYMTEAKYDRLVAVLKKNIILQGAPGVGKTFAAKRLAYSIIEEEDDDRIEFVQFHQNYSYEDFVMGYKPVENGFELKYGIFYKFCQKAANHPEKPYFFIIDEINRGNMSKIFGELLMLIEVGYRGNKATLAYNGMNFTVPANIYIIGMMNTADRSLAMIDYALRRRFSFFDMEPGFDSEGFKNYQRGFDNETFDKLIDCIQELNTKIKQDKSLGTGFCIGHSYFCGAEECTHEWMRDIIDYDILPMLVEYWFDDEKMVLEWRNKLNGALNDEG